MANPVSLAELSCQERLTVAAPAADADRFDGAAGIVVPGETVPPVPEAVEVFVNWNELRQPTVPAGPFVSKTRRSTCWPAGSEMPTLPKVCHVCAPPVLGILMGPVMFFPSHST